VETKGCPFSAIYKGGGAACRETPVFHQRRAQAEARFSAEFRNPAQRRPHSVRLCDKNGPFVTSGQYAAEGADLARGFGCGGHEGAALVLGEIEAAAFGVIELHARLGLIDTVHMNSVSQRAQRSHGAVGIIPDR